MKPCLYKVKTTNVLIKMHWVCLFSFEKNMRCIYREPQNWKRQERQRTLKFIDWSQCFLDHMKGNSISKNFLIAYFAVKRCLQGGNKVCKNGLWTKAFCCVRMCTPPLSGQTMLSPASCLCPNNLVTKGVNIPEFRMYTKADDPKSCTFIHLIRS